MSQIAPFAPVNRIRHAVYETGQPTATEPIADQELGFWIRRNVMTRIGVKSTPAEFLVEHVTCPRGSDKTARSFQQIRECVREAFDEINLSVDTILATWRQGAQSTSYGTIKAIIPTSILPLPARDETDAIIESLCLSSRTDRTVKASDWQNMYDQLRSLADLSQGWNGYNAPPPSRKAIVNAQEFLNVLLTASFRPTRLRPSSIGGVGITFRSGERKAYVEFVNDGRTHVLFSDSVNDPIVSEIEGDYRSFFKLLGDIRKYLDGRVSSCDEVRRSPGGQSVSATGELVPTSSSRSVG